MFRVVAMNIQVRKNTGNEFPARYNLRRGLSAIELMVTICLVVIIAAVVGVFLVKLLRIQEQEREEAYIREKLADICAIYADYMSVGSSFHINTNSVDPILLIKYRQEAGGVSLETGRVSRVAYLTAKVNTKREDEIGAMKLDIFSRDPEGVTKRHSDSMSGNASLIPLLGNVVSCTITPLNNDWIQDGTNSYDKTDAALGLLSVSAKYEIENEHGELAVKTATVERVVRLWNQE